MFSTHRLAACLLLCGMFVPALVTAAPVEPPALAGIPVDFILFALTLAGIALFHHYTLPIAVTGLVVISLFKIVASPFNEGSGISGWIAHLGNKWVMLSNLLGLLLGFALLSKHLVQGWYPQPKHEAPRSAKAPGLQMVATDVRPRR